MPHKYNFKGILTRYFPVFEILVWFIFMIWAIQYFWKNNQLYSFALIFILIILVIWIAWFALKDYIAGAIFKTGKRIRKNEHIRVDQYSGIIKQFNNRTMEIEAETGKVYLVPYSFLFGKIIQKTSSSGYIQKQSFKMSFRDIDNVQQLRNEIFKELLMNPATLASKEPHVNIAEESHGNKLVLDIVVYTIDKQYFYNIEKSIRNKFQQKETE